MGFAMAKGKGKKGEGFHSAAGLIRYFDAEDETAMKIDPRMVVAFCIISIVLVEALKVMFPS
jgi:preprotein translocase subunit Sec61beta